MFYITYLQISVVSTILFFFVYDLRLGDISNTICKHLTDNYGKEKLTLIEANPGPCLITKHILENTNYNICLYVNNYTAFETFLKVSVSEIQSYNTIKTRPI